MAMTSRVVRKKYINIPNSIPGPTRVKAGFPAGKASGGNIQKAIWQEFGTRGGRSGGGWGGPIPERPFMRNAVRDNDAKTNKLMKAAAHAIVIGKITMRAALAKLGVAAQGDIQAAITSLTSPPNSPVTIELKGSSKPLIDSGEMRQSVTWKIDE